MQYQRSKPQNYIHVPSTWSLTERNSSVSSIKTQSPRIFIKTKELGVFYRRGKSLFDSKIKVDNFPPRKESIKFTMRKEHSLQ